MIAAWVSFALAISNFLWDWLSKGDITANLAMTVIFLLVAAWFAFASRRGDDPSRASV